MAVVGLKPGSAARIGGHNRIYVVEIPYSLTEAQIITTPTKVLSLTQAVTEKELVNDADFEDILEDMKIECGQYGKFSLKNLSLLRFLGYRPDLNIYTNFAGTLVNVIIPTKS